MNARAFFVGFGALLGGLAVAAGAFGAHGLRELVTPERLDVFETAVRYQLGHALALLVIGLTSDPEVPVMLRRAGLAFVTGIALFSGSLYALVLTDTSWLGAVTPFGGVAFLIGWALIVLYAISLRRPPRTAG